MDLADAIKRTEGRVLFFGHDDRLVEIGFYHSARHCRIQAGRAAARVFVIFLGAYELFYDATGRYLGKQFCINLVLGRVS